ncbi:hypothetical protein GCM10010215_74510 [Streptomyces virginiae]|uniref:Uncharacterized protein n=1 Tax=Streptomyces virginiae TaxID=1961 RepID=A0ABQ3NXP0_STRVG|nr:hypothetical protein GCM10010215_74510 [Streptomyces virginiae]GHI17529.1 hypothetical protein Scinn_69920 [Streptomyces virginiae]
MTIVAGVISLLGLFARLAYRAARDRAEVRRVEPAQQGLSERVRSLPPGSRISERTSDRSVEILTGEADRGGAR